MIFRQLDSIYTACKGISKSWKAQSVSLGILSHVIEKSKFGKKVELNEQFKNNYNTMLDELLKTCREQSIGNAVSFKDLRNNINIMKRAFTKGIEE